MSRAEGWQHVDSVQTSQCCCAGMRSIFRELYSSSIRLFCCRGRWKLEFLTFGSFNYPKGCDNISCNNAKEVRYKRVNAHVYLQRRICILAPIPLHTFLPPLCCVSTQAQPIEASGVSSRCSGGQTCSWTRLSHAKSLSHAASAAQRSEERSGAGD